MKILQIVIIATTAMILLFHSIDAASQNAPVTTIATVGNAVAGPVPVPVTVTGFTNIGACSLSFDYEFSGLHFLSGTPNPLLGGFAIGDHDLGNGKHRITMGWFGSGTSLPDGSVIMTVTFTLVGGTTALEFYDNGPSCEYADGNFNVLNDLPQNTYYINGMVCEGAGNPGIITGDQTVCTGETGVNYTVAPVTNASSYNWSVPPGATITNGINTNSITVDYSIAAISGNITVNGANACGSGPSSQLPVTISPLPVANAGNDVTIPFGTSTTLHASPGGTGSFNYHWSPEALLVNPNLQNPQTVNLTVTEVFTLLVTNQASLCQNSDEVIVTISGGPLNSNPISIPGVICNGTPAQLFANAGGGSGSYTYLWTCNPPGVPAWSSSLANPVVTPGVSTVYSLSLSDGFNTITGTTAVTVYALPTATISGGDTLCGQGNSTILTVDLTGTAPWSFYYSNGISTWHVEGQLTTPYSIVANEAGIYTILAMTDEHCTGTVSGSAPVAIFPIPPTPAISVNGTELTSTGCCGNQWYKDGVAIPGATGQNYEPDVSAHYYDIVTINGCLSDTSNTIFYFMTGIRQNESGDYSIEPNPASGLFRVKSGSGIGFPRSVRILSLTGESFAGSIAWEMVNEKVLLVYVQHQSPGLYFVEIITDTMKKTLKLVLQ